MGLWGRLGRWGAERREACWILRAWRGWLVGAGGLGRSSGLGGSVLRKKVSGTGKARLCGGLGSEEVAAEADIS